MNAILLRMQFFSASGLEPGPEPHFCDVAVFFGGGGTKKNRFQIKKKLPTTKNVIIYT